jgi:hypothetical protein
MKARSFAAIGNGGYGRSAGYLAIKLGDWELM